MLVMVGPDPRKQLFGTIAVQIINISIIFKKCTDLKTKTTFVAFYLDKLILPDP